MTDTPRAARARLAALSRDRDAISAAVCDRVLARTRADPATRAEVAAHVAAIACDFHPGLYHAVTHGLVPGLGLVFTPPGRGLAAAATGLAARLAVDGPIARLRALAATTTLVIAPTHSSNLDAIVLGVALRRAGLPACAFAAGEHLYRDRLVGTLMHHLGGFRVERGRTSTLYKVALKTYATLLLERGVHTVVFPGATRCRDNRVETTIKLGLLGAAAAAERRGPRRVVIVPVTLNHQIVLEAATLIAYHLAGRGHERVVGDELFRWGRLAATARRLRALDQRVAIHFGDPLGVDGRAADPTAPPPAPDPGALAAAVVAAYRRDTILFDTHVAGRALFELMTAAAGTADPAVVVARTPPGLAFPRAAVLAAIAGTAAALDACPALGRRWSPARPPAAVLASALAAWHAAHAERVAAPDGDRVRVDHAPLLLFYQARCGR